MDKIDNPHDTQGGGMNFSYKDYVVDLHPEARFDHTGLVKWFSSVSKGTVTSYRSPPYKTEAEATADAKAWIDRNA